MTKKQLQMNEIKITKVYPRYAWKWDIREDCCLICQQEFNTACNKCIIPSIVFLLQENVVIHFIYIVLKNGQKKMKIALFVENCL